MEPDWDLLLEGTKLRTSKSTEGKQNPVYETQLQAVSEIPSVSSNGQQPTNAIDEETDIASYLTAIGSSTTAIKDRISLINQTLTKFFSSPQAKVEVVGRDGKTVVATKHASTYLNNLSIARNLVKVMNVDQTEGSNGKLTYLKVHEMYK